MPVTDYDWMKIEKELGKIILIASSIVDKIYSDHEDTREKAAAFQQTLHTLNKLIYDDLKDMVK